ncbi:hypothetical protein BH11PSE11_BH11PSE11_07820 [soil metagenome]
MKKIAFSGSLDPITNGHLWVIDEARSIAEEVVIFISENPFKKPHFSAKRRRAIIEQCIVERAWKNVCVILVKGDYTARAAKRHGCKYLIRGIRNNADFDYENLLQQANVDVLQGAKTVFVMPPRDLGSVSSSFVRGLQGPVGWHWNMQQFIPKPAYAAWILDWLHRDWLSLWRHDPADARAIEEANRWFEYLTGESAYGAHLRRYHNLDHLVHGLTEIGVWAANTEASQADIDTLKKAFWFHDAVYGVREGVEIGGLSNEEASARLWLEVQLDIEDRENVASLIRATDHLQRNTISHPLKDVMLGADLAILGQAQNTYDRYALDIRAEYPSADDETYRTNRRRVLMHFLERAKSHELYADPYFSERYVESATKNMLREIAGL